MKVTWTKWAAERVVPVPGKPFELVTNLKKAEKTVPGVPAKPKLADEVARAIKLRVNERYSKEGNDPRDTFGRDLVDLWCARAGVVFATQAVIETCSKGQLPTMYNVNRRHYQLRLDGQPWRRLREQLAAAKPAERASAKAVAAKARKTSKGRDELRFGIAYAFCDPAWVKEDLAGMFDEGYGRLALLAAMPDAKTARSALVRLLEDDDIARYQLVEEAPPHVPNLMLVLDDKDAPLIRRALDEAWNNKTRKPWQELVASIAKK
jgi:hypothetical protein